MSVAPKVATVLVAGWLAQTLASTDADIDAGVAAYEAEDFEAALGHFDAAKERLGERPEVAFDRGLALLKLEKPEEARTAFERASEAEEDTLRASAHYELGNLEFDAEAYEAAIARYTDALKANPLHANAKWNLELALLEKQKQDEEQEKEEQEQDDQEKDESEDGEQDESEDEGEQDEGEQDEGEQDESEQEQDEGEQDESEQEQQDEGEQDESEQEQQDEGEQDESEQEQPDEGEQEQDSKDEGEQPQPEEPQEQPAEPKPVERMDMKRALEQLDEQDPFTLDKPGGGYVQPEKDW
jgi:Ca-activated chloride channel family protein